jgi:hypothetical protein
VSFVISTPGFFSEDFLAMPPPVEIYNSVIYKTIPPHPTTFKNTNTTPYS